MIFSTVFAPHEPGLDGRIVGHQGDPAAADRAEAGDDAVGAEALDLPVGEHRLLGEAARSRAAGRPARGPAACPARRSSRDGDRDRRRGRPPGRAPARSDLSSRSPRVANYRTGPRGQSSSVSFWSSVGGSTESTDRRRRSRSARSAAGSCSSVLGLDGLLDGSARRPATPRSAPRRVRPMRLRGAPPRRPRLRLGLGLGLEQLGLVDGRLDPLGKAEILLPRPVDRQLHLGVELLEVGDDVAALADEVGDLLLDPPGLRRGLCLGLAETLVGAASTAFAC